MGEGMRRNAVIAITVAVLAIPLWAQSRKPQSSQPTLTITSRAVLVDVIVTGKDGQPIRDLKQNDFTVTENGKPQAITFFEPHHNAPIAPPFVPVLPANTFSNLSEYPQPPAVNVVLLDSLNSYMADQSWIRNQALKFLGDVQPGTQAAIFTMGLGLHFIQGFTSDPAQLVAALKNKKNTSVEESVLYENQSETDAQNQLVGMLSQPSSTGNGPTTTFGSPGAIAALTGFFQEQNNSQTVDRALVTLENLRHLAVFLNGFPGRKNLIWFAQSVPAEFYNGMNTNPLLDAEYSKTMNMLSAARVAIYPVDPGGVGAPNLPDRIIAEQTGGRAFQSNGLGKVMQNIEAETADFYTLSYVPTNSKMDGGFRKIKVKIAGGDYKLAYRRGYYAIDAGVPGNAPDERKAALTKYAEEKRGDVDPLLPFMDLGMPQSDQILYEARVNPLPADVSDKKSVRYGVDFTIDLKDLDLKQTPDGAHNGTLNFTLLVYDRYGKIVDHQVHVAALNIKPGDYAAYEKTGVQLHADVATPKGNYWLRTGIYDQNSGKVGTLEIPLAAVKPVDPTAAARR